MSWFGGGGIWLVCTGCKGTETVRKGPFISKRLVMNQDPILDPSFTFCCFLSYRLCGPVVRVSAYRFRGPALPDFLRSSGSEMGSTQPRE
jgi:hypothetical protein